MSEQAFVFLSEGGKALRAAGGGTLVQVTGGSARRAMPGRGLWASGAAATRALTHAAAQEWRAEGIHVALLVVDATIDSPKTEERLRGRPPEESAGAGRTSPARSPRWPPSRRAAIRTSSSSPRRATAGCPSGRRQVATAANRSGSKGDGSTTGSSPQ